MRILASKTAIQNYSQGIEARSIACNNHHLIPAQVACSTVIRSARGLVKDLGAQLAAEKSRGLVELSKASLKHAEHDCHKVMDSYGLTLPVPTVNLPTDREELRIPILRLRDWLTFVLRYNVLHNLCGLFKPDRPRERTILSTFWERFEDENPTHEAFRLAREGKLSLDWTERFLSYYMETKVADKSIRHSSSSTGIASLGKESGRVLAVRLESFQSTRSFR